MIWMKKIYGQTDFYSKQLFMILIVIHDCVFVPFECLQNNWLIIVMNIEFMKYSNQTLKINAIELMDIFIRFMTNLMR